MELQQAINLISNKEIRNDKITTWADLDCGAGLFTIVLASLLKEGSTVYAVDNNELSLRKLHSHPSVKIEKVVADFVRADLGLVNLDGIMMANSLHFVKDKIAFLQRMNTHLNPKGRYLIVEYDMDISNPWVPYPVSFVSLRKLFQALNASSVRKIREMPSRFNQSAIYSAIINPNS